MSYKLFWGGEIENKDFGPIKVQEYLNEPSFDNFSLAKVEIVGEQKFEKDPVSDQIYYVLEGSGQFVFEDEEINVKAGDAVLIRKNTKYKDAGKMTLLAFSSPRFDRDKRIREE